MGKENVKKEVLLKSAPIIAKIECVGYRFFEYLKKTGRYQSDNLSVDENDSEVESSETLFEDDINYLRSLDPKEWKDQDHYAVLGIKSLRYKATDDDIKKAYRQKVLKHHPDKRKAQGEDVRTDDDYYTCITKAYEILGTPMKRRSYDSVDPTFDDSLPTTTELKKNFYQVANKYFELNARWSEKKKVPKLGDENTSREDVERFYSFWYNFDSWREFSYLDEEEKEKGQDREERRWIEKQNKVARTKRKKEEMSRIRSLVDMVYNVDPRIEKFKKDDKDRKLAAKRAKQDAVQAKREEEERIIREAQLAKEKAEAAERARIEAKRQERETQKRALKKERKILRDLCKSNNYFSTNSEDTIPHMTNVEKLCESLKLVELEELNKNLRDGGRSVFLQTVQQLEEKSEAERKSIEKQLNTTSQSTTNTNSTKHSNGLNWTNDNVQLLIKAVNVFPAGTNQRWEVVANFINQHGNTTDGSFTAKDVLAKAKDLQKTDFSKNHLKADINKQAFNNFEKNKKNARVMDEVSISQNHVTVTTNGHGGGHGHNNIINESSNQNHLETNDKNTSNSTTTLSTSASTTTATPAAAAAATVPWTPEEQQLLEQALKTYPSNTAERWDRIAECIPNRTKKDCMRRYKELVDLIKAKKAAQQATIK